RATPAPHPVSLHDALPIFGAWGLNWQHANHMTFFPSHSYEQYYQAVRRMWRFGQQRPVTVDIIETEGEARIQENLRRKSEAADRDRKSTRLNSSHVKISYA